MSYDVKLTPVDQKTKDAFAQVCEDAGLSPKEALTLFTKSVAEKGNIPFDIKAMQLTDSMFGGTGREEIIIDEEVNPRAGSSSKFFNELMGI